MKTRLRRSGCGWALGLMLVACTEGGEPSKPASPPQVSSATKRQGVRVPLPPGWEARPSPDGELRVGPSGRPAVLRISARPGEGKSLPRLEDLRQLLPKHLQTKATAAQDSADVRILVFEVPGATADKKDTGLIGARRVNGELFLCAATPALQPAELEASVEACAGISHTGR